MERNAFQIALLLALAAAPRAAAATELLAGTARADITDGRAGPVNGRSYAKALVLKSGDTAVVIVTVDAVAIGELGRIGNDFLPRLRAELQQDLGIPPAHVIVNASHCHSIVRTDARELAVRAVKEAWNHMVPVHAGAGRGREDRIMENRRLQMKDGSETDVRRAYAMPPDEEVAAAGPVDPDIGLLRLDRKDGKPLAVLYNFAAHPIMGMPGGANTADFPGFASRAIEENLDGALAFFLQGCAGDINPAVYKDSHAPPDAERLGNLLGLSVLRACRSIRPAAGTPLRVVRQVLELPRADHQARIAAIGREQARLLQSLQGTTLNLKSFVPLFVQYRLSGDFPAYYSHRYLHEKAAGREDLVTLDAANRADLERYIRNIHTMERLTRLQTNLELLKKHQARNAAAGTKALDAEVVGLRVGDFFLVTFPGELSVEIGLGIKKRSPAPLTFVAAYTNGYLYYTPTERQLGNIGYAQEDCDTLVAPGWQRIFEEGVAGVLEKLSAPAAGATGARCTAHRGDGKNAPENTLPAFVSAARKGAPMIELDVQLSSDGQLVLMHDATVDRTTNGHGKVSDLTFAQLRALDAGRRFSPNFAGTRVPTLREALEAIPRGILLNVHLKSVPGLAAAAARTIAEMGRLEDCFLAATAEDAAAAKAVVPSIRICNMSGPRGNLRAYAEETIRLKAEFIQLTGKLDGIEEVVRDLHRHGVTVNYFGAQEAALIRRLAAAGVDYILTDDLDLCLDVLGR